MRINADSLVAEIESFYELMHNGGDENTMSVDLSVFMIEGTYNYYCARIDHEKQTTFISFQVTAAVTENEIILSDLSNVFYAIKDSLLHYEELIEYEGKRLGLFDLEGETEGEIVTYTVKASFISGDAVDNPTTTDGDGAIVFNAASNHAWSAHGWTFNANSSGGGQCDINTTTKSAYNIDLNAPSAPHSLRTYGILNYINTLPALVEGFFGNITTVTILPYNTPSSPTCPYINILGYDQNHDIWKTWEFADIAGPLAVSVDADAVYKRWITNDQMNFYLSYIPGYIANNLFGKDFYDFSINHMAALNGADAPGLQYDNPYSSPAFKSMHWYYITSGDYLGPNPGSVLALFNL